LITEPDGGPRLAQTPESEACKLNNTFEAPTSSSAQERVERVHLQERQSRYQRMMLSLSGVLGFIMLWQVSVMTGIVSGRYLATPFQIINLFLVKLTDESPDGATLGVNILSSLQIALLGFGMAIVIGVVLGLLMGWYRGFDYFMRPIFEIVRPIPPISWIPLTIVWLGIGLQAKAFIVFFAAFVPCLINSYTGIRQTSEVLINVAKTCGGVELHDLLENRHSLGHDHDVRRCARGAGQCLGDTGRG